MSSSHVRRSRWLGLLAMGVALVIPASRARAYICPPGYVSRLGVEWADNALGVVQVGSPARVIVHSGDCKHRFVVAAARVALFVSRSASGPFERATTRVSGRFVSFTPEETGLYFVRVATGDEASVERSDPGAVVFAYAPSSLADVRVTEARTETMPRTLLFALRPVFDVPQDEVFLPPFVLVRGGRASRRARVPRGSFDVVEVLVSPFHSDDRPRVRANDVIVARRSPPLRVEVAASGRIMIEDAGARFVEAP